MIVKKGHEGISIIICSRQAVIAKELESNLSNTVGIPHEIITIDNSGNNFSIFEAYNKGLADSVYPLVAFLHDDILIHTSNWGSIIFEYFNNKKNLGLLGIAGSSQKSSVPSAWWDHPIDKRFTSLIQHYPNGTIKKISKGYQKEKSYQEVIVIDGVFMVLRKSTNVIFDKALGGFHNYDQNISLEVRKKKYEVGVTNRILIEHFSLGKIDSSWIDSAIHLSKKYKSCLPQSIHRYYSSDKSYSLQRFVENCNLNKRYFIGFKFWLKHFYLKPLSRFNYSTGNYYLSEIKKYLKNKIRSNFSNMNKK
ncbi:glycosyltransferase [Salinimicrobium catena]|uniref:glycosyltransferase n=1 Tax=Salinimicrobium catena TaxID=390640 RepID=UPI002FE46703